MTFILFAAFMFLKWCYRKWDFLVHFLFRKKTLSVVETADLQRNYTGMNGGEIMVYVTAILSFFLDKKMVLYCLLEKGTNFKESCVG